MSLVLDPKLLASLQVAAAWRHLSVGDYAVSVIETATAMDVELAAFVQEGIDSIERDGTISQEEMEAWFEARYRSAAAE
ncbi:hypothetical protein [uncultured Sphingomonas sp.]|uniref:hypothetical protein n=1 Tax=uncultured Sphingomonas sp. TaxID=158754 RepID=UPI0035CAE0CA